MVYTFAAQSKQKPSQRQLIAAIRRNFGGLDTIDPVESFKKQLPTSLCEEKVIVFFFVCFFLWSLHLHYHNVTEE